MLFRNYKCLFNFSFENHFIEDKAIYEVKLQLFTNQDELHLFFFFTFHIVFRQSLCIIIKVTLFHSTSIPLCTLINQHLSTLARKFPQTKFLKSISTTCIPNYPDRNLPTIFIYFEGQMKAQFIGPLVFGGMNLKVDGKESL